MGRKILAALAGIIVAVAVVAIVETISHLLYAPPPGTDMSDPKAVEALVRGLPTGAFVWVLAAYLAGTFAGGFTAARIARAATAWQAGIVGALVLAFAVTNLVVIPFHPTWFMVAAVIGIPAAAWLAARTARRVIQST